MNPPSVPSSSKLPENNIEACEQAGTLARAAIRAVGRVQDAVIGAQIQGRSVDAPLHEATSQLNVALLEIEAVTTIRREVT